MGYIKGGPNRYDLLIRSLSEGHSVTYFIEENVPINRGTYTEHTNWLDIKTAGLVRTGWDLDPRQFHASNALWMVTGSLAGPYHIRGNSFKAFYSVESRVGVFGVWGLNGSYKVDYPPNDFVFPEDDAVLFQMWRQFAQSKGLR